MKKFFLFFAVLGLAATTALRAQDMDEASRYMMQNLPNDPAVRVGHLDNGLTYYLLHNALPEKRAEFYLATNVGGIQETPDQDGLAHFLEHMCFNGTEHFPGKGILDYLRSIGAEFGRNINASTGFEETQYMLNNIPVERPTVVDTCLMILADYSHYVLNETEEIDAERGVIIEERRQRRNAQWRLLERSFPYWFGDCKYATCTLIGLGTDYLHTAQHILSEIGQSAGIIGLLKDIVRTVVVGRVVQKARSVTAEMCQINGLESFGCRSERFRRSLVSIH